MNKKYKIALCLSGEPRSSMASFPYIYENFLQVNPKLFQVDVYSYSFKGYRALFLYNCKKHFIDHRDESQIFDDWLSPPEKKFTPGIMHQLTNTAHNFINNQAGIKNLFLMYTNIYNCFKLVDEKYDVYIRARHDHIFPEKFTNNIEEIFSHIINQNIDLIIPKEHSFVEDPNKACMDYLAIGNYKGMSYYSNLINSLTALINKCNTFKSEILLYNYLNNPKLNVQKRYIPSSVIRKNWVHSHPKITNFLDQ